MIKLVQDSSGKPSTNKDGKFIFTNGSAYFTLATEDFREMRAAMAKIETMREHEKFMTLAAVYQHLGGYQG